MPLSRNRTFLRSAIVTAALATAGLLGGCVYRLNIQQGNLLETKQVDQVTIGMTRSQVRYLIGTPMISDPFDALRWDYVYTFRRGRDRKVDRAHFVVHFNGDVVAKVEKLDVGAVRATTADAATQAPTEPALPPGEPALPAATGAPTPPASSTEPLPGG